MNKLSAIAEERPLDTQLTVLLDRQKAAVQRDMNPVIALRLDRLARLDRMIVQNERSFADAIAADFGIRSHIVTALTETLVTRAAIRHAKRHLRAWMRPRNVGVSWTFKPGRARIMIQPLGVVGIVAPWNYPLQLVLNPLVGALAAGNRAMLKPSELTPRFADVLRQAVSQAFAEDEVVVVTGGPDVAKAFSTLPFDHLLFTGSTAVGRIVAQAAARNLTPVTLELGGKSPAIIDASADLKLAANRLAWGKLLNSGQTCVAPDYALVPKALVDEFTAHLSERAKAQYPKTAGNPDYTSIVSDRHFQRLNDLVADAVSRGAKTVELVGGSDTAVRIFAPTALLNVNAEMAVMQEEIFGPILPIIGYDTLEDAIGFVNKRDRPLALYWFGRDHAARDKVLNGTISGGVTINDTIVHLAQEGLPFGGVGQSGYGHYHGELGFRAMSKEKPVFLQARLSAGSLLYPPYGRFSRFLLKILKRFG
ncbi:coniferyl aldehyde dehydrogenase [Rhizobium sp. KVB221]|uniref:Aldehyde dehydrogenase n=1 Tax=Rhizobium setariae TaxID=2801340 RepID=A0A936YMU8_9HYPH|nr:coniferyl aldehyde dehydrogenase [Rhizobium setariae]MBL0371141.1 coniferyl aldehyde dehydrogenase [Rhizobium setariae]